MRNFEWSIEVVLLLTALVLVLWCLIILSVSRFGSWNRVSLKYPAVEPPHGRIFWMESVRLGGTFYPACIKVRICREGIFLSVIPPFRLGHRPIFLPIETLHHYRTARVWFRRRSVFDVGWPRVCSVSIRRKTIDAIEGAILGSK